MSGFDHFNLIGPIYDWIFGRRKDVEIMELVNMEPHHRVLDVGGGTGRVSVLFKDSVANIWIADIARKMMFEAVEKGIAGVQTVSESLPFPDGSFDRIILVDALHHVADQNQTLSEMWRLLSPGGQMIIEEPDIHNAIVKLVALGEKLLLMRSHFLSPEEIVKRAKTLSPEKIEVTLKKGIAWVIISKVI